MVFNVLENPLSLYHNNKREPAISADCQTNEDCRCLSAPCFRSHRVEGHRRPVISTVSRYRFAPKFRRFRPLHGVWRSLSADSNGSRQTNFRILTVDNSMSFSVLGLSVLRIGPAHISNIPNGGIKSPARQSTK